jgi:hypothetical protein
LEVKIFITLYWLADPDSGEVSLSLQRLSDNLHVPVDQLTPQLGKLLIRGLILFKSNKDNLLESRFKILAENKTQDMHTKDDFFAEAAEKSDEPQAYVNDNVIHKNKSLDVNGTVNVTCAKKKSTSLPQPGRSELTARQIAQALGDEKNIALYEAYIERYPQDVIVKAYTQVLKTPHHRIRKSLGAYFTFLVGKYGGTSA